MGGLGGETIVNENLVPTTAACMDEAAAGLKRTT